MPRYIDAEALESVLEKMDGGLIKNKYEIIQCTAKCSGVSCCNCCGKKLRVKGSVGEYMRYDEQCCRKSIRCGAKMDGGSHEK